MSLQVEIAGLFSPMKSKGATWLGREGSGTHDHAVKAALEQERSDQIALNINPTTIPPETVLKPGAPVELK